jgi:NADH-ubiquinone oxidoreductase chain 5
MILTFLSAPHYPHTVLSTIADPSLLMLIPLLILGAGAAFFGFLTHEVFLGLGSTFYQQALFTHPSNLTMLDGPLSPPYLLKFLPPATIIILLTLVPKNATTTIAYILALVAAILTATYSARLMILTFLSAPHYPHTVLETIAEPPLLMLIPLIILGAGSAFFGFLTHELFLGIGSTFYQQAIFTHPENLTLLDGPLAPTPASLSFLKFLPPATLLILLTLLPISKSLRQITYIP